MRTIVRNVVVTFVLLASLGVVCAGDSSSQLVGKWKGMDTDPVLMRLQEVEWEFTKEGMFTLKVTNNGKLFKTFTGKYSLSKESELDLQMKGGSVKQKVMVSGDSFMSDVLHRKMTLKRVK